MGVWITQINPDRILPVFLLDAAKPRGDFLEGSFPADLLPAVRGALHGCFQAVLVIVEILQCNGFRADMAVAERVDAVTLDGQDLATPMLDFEATHGFTDVTGAVMGLGVGHGKHSVRILSLLVLAVWHKPAENQTVIIHIKPVNPAKYCFSRCLKDRPEFHRTIAHG